MKALPVSESSIQAALEILRSGGIVAHATETCYGLACDLQNPDALQKLFAIKKRPHTQPVSALFSSIEEAQKYTEWNDAAQALAKKHLPGPLTIILKTLPQTPTPIFITPQVSHLTSQVSSLISHISSIGIRISSHPTAQKLVEAFGSPLSTTSANIHGEQNPYSVTEIQKQYAGNDLLPDLILDDGDLPKNESSTIVNMSKDTMEVVRKGGIEVENEK